MGTKSRILSVIIMFLLTLVTLGATTVAWLSLSSRNSIQNLDLSAALDDALEISIDGKDYYKSLPTSLLSEKISHVYLNEVTSLDGRQMYGRGTSIPLKKDYISIDFWFRTSNRTNRALYLVDNFTNDDSASNVYKNFDTYEGTGIAAKGRLFSPQVAFEYAPGIFINEGELGTYYASDALRVAFAEIRDDKNINDNRSDSDYFTNIFDLTGNTDRDYGKPYGAYDYFRRLATDVIPLPTVFPVTENELTTFTSSNPHTPDNDDSLIGYLVATNDVSESGGIYYKTKVTLNIWLEAWDADMFDAIKNDTVKIKLAFKAGRKTISSLD